MGVYHQMGHDSLNLLHQENLDKYSGAILSPLNYDLVEMRNIVTEAANRPDFETIFDPQLYYPSSERGCLRQWPYFPSDIDTADLGQAVWWNQLADKIVETGTSLGVQAICSPVVVPRTYDAEYLAQSVKVTRRIKDALRGSAAKAIQTIALGLADIATRDRALVAASVISRTVADRVYLVFVSTVEPRRELSDPEELKGAMCLIEALETAGVRVLVGFSSSEMPLWKYSGASDCATGKFFNLRRFTKSRFEEPSSGGGQLAYWFEESLMAFVRESDLIRLRDKSLLSNSSLTNVFGAQILRKLQEEPGAAWVALGWRQFMYWFADFESRLNSGQVQMNEFLKGVERHWAAVEESGVLLEEIRNDGAWIRQWRRAALEFNR